MDKPNQSELPDLLKTEDLAKVIKKRETTIRTCANNAKYAHLIPRPFKLPGSRRLLWRLEDVIAWMGQAAPVLPTGQPKPQRGAPTKAEIVAAERAGLTVKEWRARQAPSVHEEGGI